jgi:hypothetical protein
MMSQIYDTETQSPRWRLYLSDAIPVIQRGGWGALAGFLGVAGLALVGITFNHFPELSCASGLALAGVEALRRFATDHVKDEK